VQRLEIAAALIEAVDKHNSRNPESRIIYVNCGAVATELTTRSAASGTSASTPMSR
jgi:branched-chain amino acid transport system substrate-binding protein